MTMPAGEYYVGDICYVLGDEWDEVGRVTGWNSDGEFKLGDGTRCAWFGTAYGDGEYYDSEGNSYPVDSGTIGCVLLNNPKHRVEAQKAKAQKLGHIFRLSSFSPYERNGHIFIGHVEVDTKEDTDWNPNYEDPDGYDEDDYEEDDE